jgi:hypothetical protein
LLTMGSTNPLLAGCPHFCRHAVSPTTTRIREKARGASKKVWSGSTHTHTRPWDLRQTHTTRRTSLSHTHTNLDDDARLPREGRDGASCSSTCSCSAWQLGHSHTQVRSVTVTTSNFCHTPVQPFLS